MVLVFIFSSRKEVYYMLSKRSIILDSLSTHRIDEGMIDSISKNSSSGSGDKLLKALLY